MKREPIDIRRAKKGLTDLDSSFPSRKPSYPVLWLVPEDHEATPWGKEIELPKAGT